MALVSVVVPTYNRRPLLQEAVGSVVAQTVTDWELIIVDDGSTDDTPEYLSSLRDPRIRVERIPHTLGASRPRNVGMALARADLIALLDDDDLFEPTKLEVQLAQMEQQPELGWSYTAVRYVDRRGRPLPMEIFKPWVPYSGHIVAEILDLEALIATPSVMLRRRAVEEAGAFDESLSFSEDFELWLRLAQRVPVLAIPQRLSIVRAHDRTETPRATNEAFVRVYEEFRARTADPKLRSICDRRIAFFSVRTANQLVIEGRYLAAWSRLLHASRRSRPDRTWARIAAKNLAYPLARRLGLR